MFAVGAAVGYALISRRDIGAGLVPPCPGAPTAPAWLRSPVTLAFRSRRASLIGWSVALLVGGAAYGSFTQPLLDGFTAAPDDLLGYGRRGGHAVRIPRLGGSDDGVRRDRVRRVTVFVVLAVQSMRGEETDGRTEPVLATAARTDLADRGRGV